VATNVISSGEGLEDQGTVCDRGDQLEELHVFGNRNKRNSVGDSERWQRYLNEQRSDGIQLEGLRSIGPVRASRQRIGATLRVFEDNPGLNRRVV
jgi:hypothetical protein